MKNNEKLQDVVPWGTKVISCLNCGNQCEHNYCPKCGTKIIEKS